jgi:hypothetical protein
MAPTSSWVQPSSASSPAASPWLRVGLITALLWVIIGLAVAFVTDRLGHPRDSGVYAAWVGPIAYLIVGLRLRLSGLANWIRAGAMAIGAMIAALIVLAFAYFYYPKLTGG